MSHDVYQHYMHGIDERLSDVVDIGAYCNAGQLAGCYVDGAVLDRSTRVSFTIRNVPRTIRLSNKLFKF